MWKKARHSEECKYDFSKAVPLSQQQKCKRIKPGKKTTQQSKLDDKMDPEGEVCCNMTVMMFTLRQSGLQVSGVIPLLSGTYSRSRLGCPKCRSRLG